MRFRIHFEVNGFEDSIVLTGDTVDEIRAKAEAELARRRAINPWSEEIPEAATG